MHAYEQSRDHHQDPASLPLVAPVGESAIGTGATGVAAGAGVAPATGRLLSHWADSPPAPAQAQRQGEGAAQQQGPAAQPGAAQPGAAQAPEAQAPAALAGALTSARFSGDPDFEDAAAGKRALRPGWGNAGTVMKLQQSLATLGFQAGTADGQWGPKTSAAVQGFQGSVAATADAVIGPKTMRALDQADARGGTGQTDKAPPGGHTDKTPGGAGPGTAGPDDKGPAHKTPAVPPPDPAKAAEEEAKFAAEGQTALAALRAAGGPMAGSSGGHTQGGPVAGFPGWFSELQQLLISSASWGDGEEKSQNILYRYAMWKTALTQGKVAPNLEVFFRYIGRSETNDQSARKGGFRSTNDLGGRSGNQNWCQAASTAAVEIALRERGLKFKGGAANWIGNRSVHKGVATYWSKSAHQVELAPGDWCSYVSPYGPETGHAVTVLESSGDSFTHTSGNAGGEAARVGQSKRGVPPQGYSIDAVVGWVNNGRQGPAPGPTRPSQDEVWTFSVTKVSNIFSELEKLDGVDPTGPDYAAVLKELGLERLK